MEPVGSQYQTSETSGLRFHVSWYNVICGHLRSMLSTTFKRHKPRPSSLVSISNPSVATLEDSVEEVEELSPSEQFSWNKMANAFFEYQTIYNIKGDELCGDTIKLVQRLFDKLLLEENKYAECIYDSMLKLDKTYAERFFSLSQLPKIRPREHMTRHVKKICELHRLLLTAFADDRTKAMQILDLLALSHVLMNITITEFRLFDLALGKFFYRMEMVDDTNVHHIVGYMSTVTTHIERLLRRHSLENRKREMLLMDNPDYLVDVNSISRENYRELKKWNQVQVIIRKAINEREDEQLYEGLSTVKVQIHDDDSITKASIIDDYEIEGWLIEFLKRGYKYKKRDNLDL